eukprot:10698-Heterococcus_DN1.PRE.2
MGSSGSVQKSQTILLSGDSGAEATPLKFGDGGSKPESNDRLSRFLIKRTDDLVITSTQGLAHCESWCSQQSCSAR